MLRDGKSFEGKIEKKGFYNLKKRKKRKNMRFSLIYVTMIQKLTRKNYRFEMRKKIEKKKKKN